MINRKPAQESFREHILLLREFVRAPLSTATIAPSSRHLAHRMALSVDLEKAGSVVELGPGTGALTSELLRRLRHDARFLAVELNPVLAADWQRQFPRHQMAVGSVADLRQICSQHQIGNVDCIVSALPWPSFPSELQESGLEEVVDVLRPGGQMVTFGYHVGMLMPSGRNFVRLIEQKFRRVERLKWVWRNLPPAYILRCTK